MTGDARTFSAKAGSLLKNYVTALCDAVSSNTLGEVIWKNNIQTALT
jgi:hypothetical protein